MEFLREEKTLYDMHLDRVVIGNESKKGNRNYKGNI